MSQGCTNTQAPSSSASAKTGKSSGRSSVHALTCVPICTPARPSSDTQRRSSRHASAGDCIGNVLQGSGGGEGGGVERDDVTCPRGYSRPRLHPRPSPQADESPRVRADASRDVVVQHLAQVEAVLRLRPVRKHYRNGGQNLDTTNTGRGLARSRIGTRSASSTGARCSPANAPHQHGYRPVLDATPRHTHMDVHADAVTVSQPPFQRPRVVLNVSKGRAVVLEHPCGASTRRRMLNNDLRTDAKSTMGPWSAVVPTSEAQSLPRRASPNLRSRIALSDLASSLAVYVCARPP